MSARPPAGRAGGGEPVFAGLDGEMSGPDPGIHRLIQIGVALDDDAAFCSRIGWSDCRYEPDALAAIGLDPADLAEGPPCEEVDERLHRWLVEHGAAEGTVIPVGWGVSGFDMPFVVATLPRSHRLLSHRSVELNAVCHTFDGVLLGRDGPATAEAWKQRSKQEAERRLEDELGLAPAWHDAGYDARASLAAWRWLRGALAAGSSGAEIGPRQAPERV
ncbi:MAG TPA: hypothetical protein VMT37_01475 [Solirubrobacterales bacterium]|nr:hypothetical protein [Solirubrobacterales bacterium]